MTRPTMMETTNAIIQKVMNPNSVEIRGTFKDNVGLFALRHFYQGERILELPEGNLLSVPNRYTLQISPDLHLDCSEHPIAALNHSCNPNAAVRGNKLIAWACIDPGEEITINYLRTETELAVPFKCECGNCDSKMIRGK